MDGGSQASGSAGEIKGQPALLPSAGRRTATAIARGRPGQSAELWKPWRLYSQSFCPRQRMGEKRKRAARRPFHPE